MLLGTVFIGKLFVVATVGREKPGSMRQTKETERSGCGAVAGRGRI